MGSDLFKYSLPNGALVESKIVYSTDSGCSRNYAICIPTYRRNEKLLQTLYSALNQDYKDSYSVIVLDNDPRNNFSCEDIKIPSNVSFKYIRNLENIGMVQNWNALCILSEAEYFTILCDDDILDCSFLKRVERVISLHPEACYVQLPVTDFQVKPESPLQKYTDTCVKISLFDVVFEGLNCNIGCMIKKDIAVTQKIFNEDEYPSFDHLLAKRIAFASNECYKLLSRRNGAYYRTCDNTSSEKKTKIGFIKADYPAYVRMLQTRSSCPSFYMFFVDSFISFQVDKICCSADEKRALCKQIGLVKKMKPVYWIGILFLNVISKLRRCATKIFGIHMRGFDA